MMPGTRVTLRTLMVGVALCAVLLMIATEPGRAHRRRLARMQAGATRRRDEALGVRGVRILKGAQKAQVFDLAPARTEESDRSGGPKIFDFPIRSRGPILGKPYAARVAVLLLDPGRYAWGGMGNDPDQEVRCAVRFWSAEESMDVLVSSTDVCVVPEPPPGLDRSVLFGGWRPFRDGPHGSRDGSLRDLLDAGLKAPE